MPQIIPQDFGKLLGLLPNWKPAKFEAGQKEIFIATVGFEDRSSSCFAQWCLAHKKDGSRAILIIYPTNQEENAIQQEVFQRIATEHAVHIETVLYSTVSLLTDLQQHLSSYQAQRLVIDISTASSYCVFPILKACLAESESLELRVLYCQAEDYFPSIEEWREFKTRVSGYADLLEKARIFDDAHFQSKGVSQVYESYLYPGSNIDKSPCKLILVPNFSHDRIHQMISYAIDRYSVKREEIEWIFGMPPDQDKNGWRHDALWELYEEPNPRHSVSTLDPLEMLQTLQDIWGQYRFTHSLVIASSGSKAQHVGTWLFLEMHPEVALVLSEPQSFVVGRYSNGVGDMSSLEFGKIGDLASRLGRWNEIEFVW